MSEPTFSAFADALKKADVEYSKLLDIPVKPESYLYKEDDEKEKLIMSNIKFYEELSKILRTTGIDDLERSVEDLIKISKELVYVLIKNEKPIEAEAVVKISSPVINKVKGLLGNRRKSICECDMNILFLVGDLSAHLARVEKKKNESKVKRGFWARFWLDERGGF